MFRRLDRASGRFSLSLLSASVKETQIILKHWVASRYVTTSFGRLAETSQIVSTEIQLHVKLGVAWPRVQTATKLKLLDTEGRPDAFKGLSRQLHRNRLFWHGNCMESSWTSSRNLWPVTWLEIKTVHITWKLWKEPTILLKRNRYIKFFCQPEGCQHKILTHVHVGGSMSSHTQWYKTQ